MDLNNSEISTVYGPVRSWRLGWSLGIDLLFDESTCSFECVYCQLGKINRHTVTRRVFVSTEQVIGDLMASPWHDVDVITFSGSGEPTLASNLGEAIQEVRKLTGKKVAVLTNSSLLSDSGVRRDLALADSVICKLDASNATSFRAINRPHPSVHYDLLVEGIRKLAAEMPERVAVQTMIGHMAPLEVARFAAILATIGPAEVQLNTPFRPVPRVWSLQSRAGFADAVPVRRLKVIDQKSADEIETALRRLTGLKITSVYQLNKGEAQ